MELRGSPGGARRKARVRSHPALSGRGDANTSGECVAEVRVRVNVGVQLGDRSVVELTITLATLPRLEEEGSNKDAWGVTVEACREADSAGGRFAVVGECTALKVGAATDARGVAVTTTAMLATSTTRLGVRCAPDSPSRGTRARAPRRPAASSTARAPRQEIAAATIVCECVLLKVPGVRVQGYSYTPGAQYN